MAVSSWRWPRPRAAFATSLAWLALAGVAVAQAPGPVAEGKLGDVTVFAVVDGEQVLVDWRHLRRDAPGRGDVSVDLSPASGAPEVVTFSSVTDELRMVGLAGDSGAVTAERVLDVVEAVSLSLDAGTLLLLRPGSEVGADGTPIQRVDLTDLADATPAGFAALKDQAENRPPLGSIDQQFLARAVFENVPTGVTRQAVLAPRDMLDPSRLGGEAGIGAMVDAGISLFPIGGAPDPELDRYAGRTGGFHISDDIMMSEAVAEALLGDVLSGATYAFDLPSTRQYALPGESSLTATVTVSSGESQLELPLSYTPEALSPGGLVARAINPKHWGAWLRQDGRFGFGALALGLNLLICIAIGLVVRAVRRGREGEIIHEPVFTAAPGARELTIGRASSNTIAIAHPSVSRAHAVLHLAPPAMRLVDVGSSNGTAIKTGPDSWAPVTETTVTEADTVRFGDYVARVADLVSQRSARTVHPVTRDESALERFKNPRRNPYTGEIEEGG